MRKNRFKSHQAKLKKRKVKPFSFRLLLLSMLLGVAGVVTALTIALMLRGVEINWGSLLSSVGIALSSGVAIAAQNKADKGRDNGNPDIGVSNNPRVPNNPSGNNEDLDAVLARRRKDENYSDIHRYLN